MIDFPDLRQIDEYDCGITTAQAILAYYGFNLNHTEIARKLTVTKDEGVYPSSLVNLYRELGLETDAFSNSSIEGLKKRIRRGYPVQILIQAWPGLNKEKNWESLDRDGHYVVAIGMNGRGVTFEDPYIFGRMFLSFESLEKRWHHNFFGNKYVGYGISVIGEEHWSTDRVVDLS